MNILFVNNNPFNPMAGGIERVTDILAKELLNRGYGVFYLWEKIDESKLYLLNYEYPVKFYQLPEMGLFDNDINISFYKRLLAELNINVVINQRGAGGWFNACLRASIGVKRLSVIHSVPECDVVIGLNNIIKFTTPPFVGVKRFIKKTFRYFWERKVVKEQKIRYSELIQHSDVVVTLSKRYIDSLKRFVNPPYKSKLVSIPNPNPFPNVGEVCWKKGKIILYVGRLNKEDKNPMRILKIWKYLNIKHPDWQLKILGEGDERLNMQDYVEKQNLLNVYFEGRQSNVEKYYKEASFICLTSNFEGWPMALIEGMQYGCIPFTFNNFGASYDIIDNDINGCIVSAFNIKEYASRLSKLMTKEDERMKMSKASIIKVEGFSVGKIVDEWEKVFQRLGV